MNNRKVDLSAFTKKSNVIIKEEYAQDGYYSSQYRRSSRTTEYTNEEIDKILNSSSLASQQQLSRYYYEKDGFYAQIINYYATLLSYSGLLIPIPSFGKQLSNKQKKKYGEALAFLENLNIKELLTKITCKVLVDGSYCGLIQALDSENCIIIELSSDYCRSRFKDIYGNDIIEFNVTYFDSITDESVRKETLNMYPKDIVTHYNKYKKGKVDTPWIMLSSDVGIYFSLFTDYPLFVNIIPATLQYDEAVDTERERELEEIRKIIVQRIPHMQDGQLLFEPDEALEMHQGAVNMMRGNKNLSVLTTYADVDAIISKTAAENATTSLEKMMQNIYSNAGVSGQLFAPTNTQALPYSIKCDISLMMVLGNKYSRLLTYLVNEAFATGDFKFRYSILPITEYTKGDFITDTLKLAQSGYSFLLPAIAAGLNQLELMCIKDLENNTLKLTEVLIPLASSYTQSQSSGKVGAPEKNLEDKAPKTIQNEDALNT